jgi:hypothetical protein
MKMTRTLMMIWVVLTCFSSCEKDDHKTRKTLPVVAGQQLSIFVDWTPDLKIIPYEKCTTVGTQTACGMECGLLELDLNNDQKKDIRFKSCTGSTMADLNTRSTAVEIIETDFQIVLNPFLDNETISNSNDWSPARLAFIAKKTGAWGEQMDFNEWTGLKYMAFRRVTPTDTLFGWIRLKVDEYNQLTVDAYAMQK